MISCATFLHSRLCSINAASSISHTRYTRYSTPYILKTLRCSIHRLVRTVQIVILGKLSITHSKSNRTGHPIKQRASQWQELTWCVKNAVYLCADVVLNYQFTANFRSRYSHISFASYIFVTDDDGVQWVVKRKPGFLHDNTNVITPITQKSGACSQLMLGKGLG